MKRLRNNQGMTLIELIFAVAILVIVSIAVSDVMLRTAREVLAQSRENVAETSAKNILMRMAEDVRKAYYTGNGAFWNASDASHVYITLSENKDQYSVPDNGDLFKDVACYEFRGPIGSYGDSNYVPGIITGGTDNGDSVCEASSKSVISDANMDIVDMNVQYCRPANGLPGTYNCDSVMASGNMLTDSQCVWLVKMRIRARRLPTLNYGEPHPNPNTTTTAATYTTSVKPRNLYLGSLAADSDKNNVVDCCDANFVGTDVTWCPPPTKF